ncbi:MAG: hypothetical protein CSA22_00020 [Deltaproteobacteria bacterium]|nr:MAG: hypothetical protein CSA22_00020 [Deltaproteobacteria bacterium]
MFKVEADTPALRRDIDLFFNYLSSMIEEEKTANRMAENVDSALLSMSLFSQYFADQVLDTYETNVELRELYLQLSPAKQLDIKTGRQIVVWGTSDVVRLNTAASHIPASLWNCSTGISSPTKTN